jgi:hypothetical protein
MVGRFECHRVEPLLNHLDRRISTEKRRELRHSALGRHVKRVAVLTTIFGMHCSSRSLVKPHARVVESLSR